MKDLARSGERLPQAAAPCGRCEYCGAALSPAFYFCPRCATPFRALESVLPPVHVPRPTEGQLIARRAPHVWPLFFTYLGVVLAVAILGYLAFGEEWTGPRLILALSALFVTTCVFAALHWRSLAVQLRRLRLLHPASLLGILSLAPLLAVNYAYHTWILELAGKEAYEPFAGLREAGLGEPLLVLVLCVFPAVTEEIAFRGLVQHWLQVAIRPARALVLASALFTALHFSVLSAPYLFAVGMVLGAVKWKTGSLYPPVLIHLLHNLVVVEFLWGPW